MFSKGMPCAISQVILALVAIHFHCVYVRSSTAMATATDVDGNGNADQRAWRPLLPLLSRATRPQREQRPLSSDGQRQGRRSLGEDRHEYEYEGAAAAASAESAPASSSPGLQVFARIDGGAAAAVEVLSTATVGDVIRTAQAQAQEQQSGPGHVPDSLIAHFQGTRVGAEELLSDIGAGSEAVIELQTHVTPEDARQLLREFAEQFTADFPALLPMRWIESILSIDDPERDDMDYCFYGVAVIVDLRERTLISSFISESSAQAQAASRHLIRWAGLGFCTEEIITTTTTRATATHPLFSAVAGPSMMGRVSPAHTQQLLEELIACGWNINVAEEEDGYTPFKWVAARSTHFDDHGEHICATMRAFLAAGASSQAGTAAMHCRDECPDIPEECRLRRNSNRNSNNGAGH